MLLARATVASREDTPGELGPVGDLGSRREFSSTDMNKGLHGRDVDFQGRATVG